jgi:acyl-CoA reductase-like NAD-dependent aldehyde dehydrogenase
VADPAPDPREAALRATLERLEAAGDALRARSPEWIAEALARAWAAIADPELALGRAARSELPGSTGLSLPMVAWALHGSMRTVSEASLREATRRMAPPEGTIAAPARLGVLVLAGNVFTACVQPWTLALLARAPLLVKASSRDDVLPRLFHAALAETAPELADACAVVSFPGGIPDLDAALVSRADVVSVYGSDATLGSLRARLAASTAFVPHGHGLGAGFVGRDALTSEESARRAAEAFSLDVAAYDQRGCLSPHAIWVERGAPIDAMAWSRMLFEALEGRARSLPRGPLTPALGAAQLQWRGVAAVRGELLEGDGWAVACEPGGALRVSPGYRNVLVLEADDPRDFTRRLGSLGVHLKCVGVAGTSALRAALAGSLAPPLAPRVCEAGRMQLPGLLSLADGRPPWEGLQRFTALE